MKETHRHQGFYQSEHETQADKIGDRLVGGTQEITEVLKPDEKLTDSLSVEIHERLERCALCKVWEEKPNLTDETRLCEDCELIPPPKILDRARVNDVAAALLGTCKSLESETTEEEREDTAFLRALDDEIFLCDQCGWWCEVEECNEEGFCEDCADE